ncbi:gephyrin-like molybdotransferase Glp [Microbacterium sp.]|uniref:molybdopterin molybdotransferase MoeA n=1 Tax=Microbacterium sp. TaxID=51671 RepID=UPI0025F098A5|nr:gephyrin-like molybdotransferase Glp [Microbacterium sp.]
MTVTPPSTPAQHARAVEALLAPVLARLADPTRAERVDLSGSAALGRVLAVAVTSPVAVPPFANAQMDGYAVRAADIADASAEASIRLPIRGTSAAGDPVGAHTPGSATAIMTGAPLPVGADAVVPIEVVDPPRFVGIGGGIHDAPADAAVAFLAPTSPGTYVRPAGADLAVGDTILDAATRLGPAQLGALAAAGITTALVRPRVRVLLISTGHELRAPGAALGSGQIYDANTSSLRAALVDCGALVETAFAPDDAAAVRDAITAPLDVDLVVTTGGVSAGAFEVVRDALEPVGVRFGHVAMQPGGPQGLGTARLAGDTGTGTDPGVASAREVPVIAFPGNPVSALLSFEMFLRPVLRRAAGLAPYRPTDRAPLAHDISSPEHKHQVRRGALRPDGTVEVSAPGSHLLRDYARATVLVHVPIGVAALPAGAEVEIWRIDE